MMRSKGTILMSMYHSRGMRNSYVKTKGCMNILIQKTTECVSELKMCVGFKVLTAVVMKSVVSWDIQSCSPLKVNRPQGVK
jgi:hypothetical protein